MSDLDEDAALLKSLVQDLVTAERVLFSACQEIAQRRGLDWYEVRTVAAGFSGVTLEDLVNAPPGVKLTALDQKESWRRRTYALLAERDGESCRGCDATDGLQIDHVMPKALGGGNEPGNLQLLCGPCNRRKRNKHPDVWRAELLAGKAI